MTGKENLDIEATDASKGGLIALVEALRSQSKSLPGDKRYDVKIEITEATDE